MTEGADPPDVAVVPQPGLVEAFATDDQIVPLGDEVRERVAANYPPRVDALAAYLAGPDAGASWAAAGNFLSPKSSIPDSTYPSGYRRSLATLLGDAGGFSLDASDDMPPEVGSDLLWEEIAKWMTGAEDYDEFARRIDAALERARE